MSVVSVVEFVMRCVLRPLKGLLMAACVFFAAGSFTAQAGEFSYTEGGYKVESFNTNGMWFGSGTGTLIGTGVSRSMTLILVFAPIVVAVRRPL